MECYAVFGGLPESGQQQVTREHRPQFLHLPKVSAESFLLLSHSVPLMFLENFEIFSPNQPF